MAFGDPLPVMSKLSVVPAGNTITPLRGINWTGTGIDTKLSGLIFAFFNSALISAVVIVVPPGPGTPVAGTSILSSQETAVNALLLISSIIPNGAVPLLTVDTIWFPDIESCAIAPGSKVAAGSTGIE